MKPVSVSSYGRSAATAMRGTSEEETIVVANVPRARLCTRWSASSAPTSSPRSMRHPLSLAASGTATAHRSASGSFAMTRSTGPVAEAVSRAVAKARSIAPGSSGLGKETVGKSGSGSAC